MSELAKPVRQKMSVTTVAGFRCTNCAVETVTHDNSTPTACLNCGTQGPVLAWKNIVKDVTTVEIVPF